MFLFCIISVNENEIYLLMSKLYFHNEKYTKINESGFKLKS